MSAQIILHPRSKEPIGVAVWRLNQMGYCLRNFHGSAFVHVVPMAKPVHPTIQWLKEITK